MQKILLSGCNGRMGRKIFQLCSSEQEIEVVAGIDLLGCGPGEFPVFVSPSECNVAVDVVIDFSSPAALEPLLAFCVARRLPVVLATTGYSEEQVERIKQAAEVIPVFRSANMSLGLNLLLDLVRRAASALEGYDIEIVERHHNRKVDAPSGTAILLAGAATAGLDCRPEYVCERASERRPRGKHEIGLSSVRGGTIVGDHEVIFAGPDEVIELHHHAASRDIFAAGALRAARFLGTVSAPQLYDMASLTG